MKKVKVAIFISDVGFGHMVRQREIIRQLLKSFKNLEITVINFEHIEILKETFGKKINYPYLCHTILKRPEDRTKTNSTYGSKYAMEKGFNSLGISSKK